MSERIIRGLEARDIGAHWEPAAEQPWYQERRSPDGTSAFFLTKVDDHCIFLRSDNLCAVHAAFGAEAKPAFCREFPIHLVRDPTGLVAIVRSDCGTFHESFDGDVAVEPQARTVLDADRVIPMRTFNPEVVEVLPGVGVPLDTWLEWEAELQALLDAEVRSPEEGVALLRAELHRRLGREAPEADPRRGRMALQAGVQAMTMVMDKVLAEGAGSATPEQQAFAEQMRAWLGDLQSRATQPLPQLDARCEAYLHIQLRTLWIARQWTASGSVIDGLGAHLFHITCCRILAGADVDGPITAAAFADRHAAWRRLAVNRMITWVLGKAKPALQDVYRNGV